MSKFKLLDKGAGKTILFIPGWAADYRIFGALDPGVNRLLPVEFSPRTFEEGLLGAMGENGIGKVSILGHSMGGFAAARFAASHREKVDKVILVGVRRAYKKEALEDIKDKLAENRRAWLYKFYKGCFSKNEETSLAWFRKNLLDAYLDGMGMDALIDGLDYLLENPIEPSALAGTDVKFIHGTEDRVAPIEEALSLKSELAHAEFIPVKGAGHMPFLGEGFKDII